LRQPSDIRRLLSCEPRALQRRVVEARDPLRAYRSGDLLQPHVSGTSGGERDLLLEDDLHQGLEAGRAIPQRRRAVARHDRRKMRIPPRQLGDAFGQRVCSQLRHHVYQNEPTCLVVR